MQRGEVWFAATPGGDRPVLVLTRDPVADRIGSVVVAAITRTLRGLVSELELTATEDGVPTDCVVNFDNIHTIPRDVFRRRVVKLEPPRLAQACQRLPRRHWMLRRLQPPGNRDPSDSTGHPGTGDVLEAPARSTQRIMHVAGTRRRVTICRSRASLRSTGFRLSLHRFVEC